VLRRFDTLEDNFYPFEKSPVEYLFLTEKYLVAPGREKFVNDFYFGKKTQQLQNNKHKNSKQ